MWLLGHQFLHCGFRFPTLPMLAAVSIRAPVLHHLHILAVLLLPLPASQT